MNLPFCKPVDPVIAGRQCSCCSNMVSEFATYVVSYFHRPSSNQTHQTWHFTSCQFCGNRHYRSRVMEVPSFYQRYDVRIATYRTSDGKPLELLVLPRGETKIQITKFD